MSKIFFDKIPVVKVDNSTEKIFERLIENIQQNYTKEKAISIDQRLFDLYNLTDEERSAIGFVEIR